MRGRWADLGVALGEDNGGEVAERLAPTHRRSGLMGDSAVMFGLFRDKRDIDQVVFDVAERRRPRDSRRLFELLRGRELFSPVASSNVPFVDGGRLTVQEGDDIKLKTGKLPNGMSCVVLYVHRHDSRLAAPYIGITMPDALDMVAKMEIDSLLIQGGRESWVAFPKGDVPGIRKKYF